MYVTVKSFFLLWLFVQPSTSHAFSVPKLPQPTVIVGNDLQGGQDLFHHCKSVDDDLGVQHLHPHGYFSWSFEINFFRTTLFHCSFQWESVLHRFDVPYAVGVVREDGPCMIFTEEKDQCSPWNSLEERPNFLS